MIDLPHSPTVYRQRRLTPFGPFVWMNARSGSRALLEVAPWDAAGVMAFSAVALVRTVGTPDGIGLAFCIGLPLVALEMQRTCRFLTRSRIVWERGLIWRTRTELPLCDIDDAEIELYAESGPAGGDIHLQTRSGPLTLWAVVEPAATWERVRALRDSGTA